MNKLRWQLLLVGLALVAIAILLFVQKPLLQGLTAQPAQGGIYIEGLVGSIGRLNPLLDSANPADQDINRLLFSGLVRFDDRGTPQPDLAETWGISLDGLQYNFALREGLTWQDGEPLTTADVAFTVELLKNPSFPISEDIRKLWESVEVFVFDDLHMQFRLPSAYWPFMNYLSFGVLPQHLLGEMDAATLMNAPYNLEPVGSGPYRFGELLNENNQVTGVVLNAWDGYYAGRPFIDQVVFHYYETAEAAYQAYQEGDVLGISYIDAQLLPTVLSDPTLNVYSTRLPSLGILLLNLDNAEKPFFQETQVRQALMYGINRQWIVDEFLGGQAMVADGPILPGTWAYNEAQPRIPYDSETAISYLKQAGYTIPAEGGQVRSKEGISLEFELVYPDTALHSQIAESIRKNFAEIGIQVTLVAVPYEQLISDYLEPRTYEAALVDLNFTHEPDPDPYPFWHQAEATGGQNYSKWNDRRASEYLELARAQVAISQSQRARLYRNFQAHFAREMPALPLYFPIYNYAISSQVRGVSVGPIFQSSDRFATINEWFLVARGQAEELDATPQPESGEPTATSQP
ncbi:MAG: peptide ABC transporter substrate-binding protein [Chloroflexi bacterium]|nr:peptide ABC transporter substrate-binding protein [Chloroflexota bacterium]